jgi:hypothetical protein
VLNGHAASYTRALHSADLGLILYNLKDLFLVFLRPANFRLSKFVFGAAISGRKGKLGRVSFMADF